MNSKHKQRAKSPPNPAAHSQHNCLILHVSLSPDSFAFAMCSSEQQLHIHHLAAELAQAAAQMGPNHQSHVNIHDRTSALVIKIGSLALGNPFNKTYMHSSGITDSLLRLLTPHSLCAPAACPQLVAPPSFVNAICRTLKCPGPHFS